MPVAILQCYRCGRLNEVKVQQRQESRLIGLCFACDKFILFQEGGLIYQLEKPIPGALFALGYIRIAPMAYANLAYLDKTVMTFHACLVRDFPDDHPYETIDEEYEATLPETKVAFEATIPYKLLVRHASGNWENSQDTKENKEGLLDESLPLLSTYTLNNGLKVWVQTDAYRPSTTIMLPEER